MIKKLVKNRFELNFLKAIKLSLALVIILNCKMLRAEASEDVKINLKNLTCIELLVSNSLTHDLMNATDAFYNDNQDASKLAHDIEKALEPKFKKYIRNPKGFALVVSGMLVSTALATYLNSNYPTKSVFFQNLIAHISLIGFYIFGAPILEPITSAVRKFGFEVSSKDSEQKPLVHNPDLDNLWPKTQRHFSLNSQMSRNVINSFLTTAQPVLYGARQDYSAGNNQLAARQIALLAVRLHRLFTEISADNIFVTQAVRSIFYLGDFENQDVLSFSQMISKEIQKLEQTKLTDSDLEFYKKLIQSWLHNEVAS